VDQRAGVADADAIALAKDDSVTGGTLLLVAAGPDGCL
jgi:hypothetical protein